MFENFKVPKELIPSDPRFGVGPSLVPVAALEKLAQTGHKLLGNSHRKNAVKNLVKEVQEGIKTYFNLPAGYEVVLGNGGATLLWDMIGLGMVEKSSLHYVTGEFSDKWFRSHKLIPWIQAKEVKVEFGQGVNPREEAGHDFICCTLNETSTGVMVSNIPKMKDSNVLLGVDATSGAGQIKVDFNNVDVYYFSPQKVFASEGGLYVAILSPKAIERTLKIAADKTRYVPEFLKWSLAIENSRANQTYNTPAISTLFFMNEQIKLMNQLGEGKVLEEAQRKARLMYNWAESKPYLKPYIQDAQFRSQSVATIDVDDKFNTEDLSKVLRAQNVAYDIDSYRKLGRNQFRVSLFHNVSYDNLEKLTKIISLAIESEK
ncbi:MAG TPA: aminotransferase class V-fold PLP-dependent enzyme [Bacteriovoracaceae bacterium]|nr:aminotransferase class V-fold PLP-dependent enzyme [Bacteriovoracaceae bacterium]